MESPYKYKLLQAVDPTKIKVAIREKFAKLTLSSTKKKKDQEAAAEEEAHLLETRKSASRNLFDVGNTEETQPKTHVREINLMLRRDSSGDSTDSDATELNSEHEAQIIKTEGAIAPTKNDALEQKIDDLSEQISNIAMGAAPETTTSGGQSKESEEELRLTQMPRRLGNYTLINPDNSICISSSDSEHSSEADESDEDGVITVSDCSTSGGAFESPANSVLVTSDIPPSGSTADALLPNTLSNERADRLEAFLRDVSQERKNLEKQMAVPTTPPKESDLCRAQRLAAADTESMSPEVKVAPMVGLPMDDTTPMSQSCVSLFAVESHARVSEAASLAPKGTRESCRRLADDETEMNTLASLPEDSDRSASDVSRQSVGPRPEDSLVIPETSSEAEEDNEEVDEEVEPEAKPATPSDEGVASGEEAEGEGDDGDGDSSDSQPSQIKVNMGSINISAKINIKIHIPEVCSDSSGRTSTASSEGADGSQREASLPATDSGETEINVECQQQQPPPMETRLQNQFLSVQPLAEECDEEGEEVDEKFMTEAEKLLNQLYGKAWQTPEVIRTLKRTSGSDRKRTTNETPVAKLEGERGGKERGDETEVKKKPQPTEKQQAVLEETALGEFSIFRRNIEKTNLDSTRLVTPTARPSKIVNKHLANVRTEPRRRATKRREPIKPQPFKIPQTEWRRRRPQTPGNTGNERWRALIDSDTDSSGCNASDDSDADQTAVKRRDEASSDDSWHKSSSEEDDDDKEEEEKRDTRTRRGNRTTKTRRGKNGSKDQLIYLDLTKDEVEVEETSPSKSPPVNYDDKFSSRLEEILRTCKPTVKPQLEATPQPTKSRRKLFTVNHCGDDDEAIAEPRPETPKQKWTKPDLAEEVLSDAENIDFNGELPARYEIINKRIIPIKGSKPLVFPRTPTRTPDTGGAKGTPTGRSRNTPTATPVAAKTGKELRPANGQTPSFKYGFLKSLDVCVSKSLCHAEALQYRENYRQRKEELAQRLYKLYNEMLFNCKLSVPLSWNKKLSNTAGRCLNKKKLGVRSSVIELSEKVLTSPDRLRCTLIHELCHAATWIFNGEGGHGSTWKEWARRANLVFPELPRIGVCHQYDIEYKYTYKCTLCGAKSHAHSKSKKVENIRCSYCHGAIEIFLNKKDKEGNILPTPVKEPTGFAKFVKDNYKQYKRPDLKHADVMKLLSNEFAALKVAPPK